MEIETLKDQQFCERPGERGQTILFVLLVLGIFLLAASAFAVDIANIWFHRQSAQNAADAACTAGAMDMLAMAQGGPASGNFTPGTTPIDCTTTTPNTATTAPTPCWYASTNGYASVASHSTILTSDTASNDVYVAFPTSVPGVTTPPNSLFAGGAPFIQVNVIDRVQTFFIGLLSGKRTMSLGAVATCGGVLAQSPVPIVVLNRIVSGALSLSGTPTVKIYGGPSRSIEVNSNSSSAVNPGGTIDLHQGGPNLTGSDFDVFGSSPQCCNFNPGTTGNWFAGVAPIDDPLWSVPAPPSTGTPQSGPYQHVAYSVNGCPDVKNGCDEYAGGYYQNGLDVKNGTAIFDPGIYYVQGFLHLESNSTVRPSNPSTAPGNGTQGTIFYLDPGSPIKKCSGIDSSVCVDSNSGSSPACTTPGVNSPNGCLDSFNTTKTGQLPCTPTSITPGSPPLPVSGVVDGNVFLAPCSGTYGDPLGGTETGGEQRGIVFFQDRSTPSGVSGQLGGGGALLVAGTMYFHQCVVSGPDTGAGCSPAPTAYNATLNMGGNSGSQTYVLGSIYVDQLDMHGTPNITMDLNSNYVTNVLKVSLLQ